MRSLLVVSAVVGFVLVLSLVLADLAVWTATTPEPPGTEFFDPSPTDTVLHDSYYVVASTGRLVTATQLGLLHVLAAMFCAANAHALRGALPAGWMFVVGAALAFIGQASMTIPAWLLARTMPQRYADMGETFQALATMQTVSTSIALAGFVVMLLGWPAIAVAALRRPR